MNVTNMRVPRRIVLSRKGFDSGYGGCASPIVESRLLSLPIPEDHFRGQITYNDVMLPPGPWLKIGTTFGDLLRALPHRSGDRVATPDSYVHLDPDIRLDIRPSSDGRQRQPTFGQCCAADGHLRNRKIGAVEEGDLFLFFGWFCSAELSADKKINFVAPDMHVIWGWLQVARRDCPNGSEREHGYKHPHFQRLQRSAQHRGGHNSVYIASPSLSLYPELPGWGAFENFDEALCLTAAEGVHGRSLWKLPACFEGRLSNIGEKAKWLPDGEWRRVQRRGPGQEFVLNTDGIEALVRPWLTRLFTAARNTNR